MSKTGTCTLPREAEAVLFTKVNPTGTSHALTLVVTQDPVTKKFSLTISNPRLEIKNGDKVTWDVSLPDASKSSRVIIKFKGSRIMDTINGPVPGPARVSVPADVLGYTGTFQDSKESYSVTLFDGTTSVVLPYPSTSTDPTPYLVIDDIGDPPPKGMRPRDPHYRKG